MGHGIGKELKPYRVEWRANLVTGWVMLRQCDTHDEALEAVAEERRRHGGQARAISQHVIEVQGLGA